MGNTKTTIEGTVKLCFSENSDTKCACCPEGKHIFTGYVQWENHQNIHRKMGDANDLVHQFIFQDKPSLNGKRVKLTIELID